MPGSLQLSPRASMQLIPAHLAPVLVDVDSTQTGRRICTCLTCGKCDHERQACPFRQAKCYKCGKSGHIFSACKSSAKNTDNYRGHRPTHHVDSSPPRDPAESSGDEQGLFAFTVNHASVKPIVVDVSVAGQSLTMEVDTGAAVSIASESTFCRVFPKGKLAPCSLGLRTEAMKIVGTFKATVRYKAQCN